MKQLRFAHVGLSSDGEVFFAEMDNGLSYTMPLTALAKAENWDPEAYAEDCRIIHEGYAAEVIFSNFETIDFPWDFLPSFCEPTELLGKRTKGRGVGRRLRHLREQNDLTLEELAERCGIAKPNLSRLEHDKVTPTFDTLRKVAAALGTRPCYLVSGRN